MPSKFTKLFIATCKDYPNANKALEHLKELLLKKGLECEFVIWQELFAKDMDKALILPLAVWDYALHYEKFKQFLGEFSFTTPASVLLKNSKKDYLFELERFNLPIIPSVLLENFKANAHSFEKPIIKPLVGQSGRGVRFLDDGAIGADEFPQGAIIQPFIASIYELGELCLVFFEKHFQYAVHRRVQKDWRANSNYGVQTALFKDIKEQWIELALRALEVFSPQPLLYARVDILPQKDGSIFINEVELIEPSLYLNLCLNASENFAKRLIESYF